MGKVAVGRLAAFGGDKQYQYAHFTLEYDQASVQIRIEIEAPNGSVYLSALTNTGSCSTRWVWRRWR